MSHNDVKPENFLFKRKGEEVEVILADFGMEAKSGGTPIYCCPEIFSPLIEKSQKNGTADIYSLGMVFLYLLTGDLFHFFVLNPITSPSVYKILKEKIFASSIMVLIEKMISFYPTGRPSIECILDELENIQNYTDERIDKSKLKKMVTNFNFFDIIDEYDEFDQYYQR